MAGLLTRGGVEWGGPGPRREPVAVSEARDVADVGENARRDDGADTREAHQVRATLLDDGLDLDGERSDLLLDRHQVGQLVRGDAAAGLPDDVARTNAGEHRLCLQGGDVLFALPGVSSASRRCNRFTVATR